VDKYLDDAARIFAASGAAGFFPDLEGFPDDQAATGGLDSFIQFDGYPGVTVEEIKKALRVRNAFSNMLDEMQSPRQHVYFLELPG